MKANKNRIRNYFQSQEVSNFYVLESNFTDKDLIIKLIGEYCYDI